MSYYILKSLGWLLQNYHADESKQILKLPGFNDLQSTLIVTSEQFKDGESMPLVTAGKFIGGEEKSPQLSVDIPDLTNIASLVLFIQDLDPPVPSPINHGVFFNFIPSGNRFDIGLGDLTKAFADKSHSFKVGHACFNGTQYIGPAPPPAHGPHRYVFQFLAINKDATEKLNELSEIPGADAVLNIIKGNVITTGLLTGKYERI